MEVTHQLTFLFRSRLGANDKYHCGFLGHVGMELLLDSALIERYPLEFERYYSILDMVDPRFVQAAVNQMARRPTENLAHFIELFRRSRFLGDYSDDTRLLVRLNQVLQRVKLSPLPDSADSILAEARDIVRNRVSELLPTSHFCAP